MLGGSCHHASLRNQLRVKSTRRGLRARHSSTVLTLPTKAKTGLGQRHCSADPGSLPVTSRGPCSPGTGRNMTGVVEPAQDLQASRTDARNLIPPLSLSELPSDPTESTSNKAPHWSAGLEQDSMPTRYRERNRSRTGRNRCNHARTGRPWPYRSRIRWHDRTRGDRIRQPVPRRPLKALALDGHRTRPETDRQRWEPRTWNPREEYVTTSRMCHGPAGQQR